MEFISPEGLRQDGRRPQELRQLQCEIGVLPKADGSAIFEMGNTKVLAAVSGPKAGAKYAGIAVGGLVKTEAGIAAFCQTGERRRRSRRDRRLQELRHTVQATLEQVILLDLLPRSQVEVYVQVLQADGGERAACVNAAVLAVANAGHISVVEAFCLKKGFGLLIYKGENLEDLAGYSTLPLPWVSNVPFILQCISVPMRDLAAACTVGYLESTALLDINLTEVNGQGPQTVLVAHPNLDTVVIVESSGGTHQIETLQEIHELAMEGAKAVAQFMRTALLSYTTKLAICHG